MTRTKCILGGILVTLAFGSTASATVDEQVVVYFNSSVLELPSATAQVAPAGLVACHPQLLATMTTYGVDLVIRAVPDFDLADTLLTTPRGLEIKMPDLARLYVLRTAGTQRDALVDALRVHPFVVFAEKQVGAVTRQIPNDTRFHLQWAVNDQSVGTESALADVRAIAAWGITQGSSEVSIGIMDPAPPAPGGGRVWDGHPEFQGRVSGEMNAPIGEHATVVAGVAAARGNNGQGIAGVDWNAHIVTRTFHDGAQLVDDMYYMIDNGVDVVNHSWGQGDCEYNISVAWAGALAYKANLLNVVAMPEDQNSCIFPNAYAWGGLDVGATTVLAQRAAYSHPHPFIDVGAPGGDLNGQYNEVYSTSTQPPNDPYVLAVGTSFAAPHVTGAASLLKAFDPSLYNDDIANLIRYSADDVNAATRPGFDEDIGWGRLNVHAALLRLQSPHSLVHAATIGGTVHTTLPSDNYLFVDLPGQADGIYSAIPVEVRRTVTFNTPYAVVPRVWGRGVETIGYANIDPNFTFGWCAPVGAVSTTGATLRTYVFDVYTVLGEHVGWFPTQPNGVNFAYSVNGIQDLAPPSVTVTAPNGGNYVETGQEMTIIWSVTDEYPQGVQCNVYLDGPTFYQIAVGLFLGTNCSIVWEVPSFIEPGNTYRVRVVARDTNNHLGIDSSDGVFTIAGGDGGKHDDPPPPCEYPCQTIVDKPPVYLTDLLPVTPNPFNQDTRVRFTLKDADEITLRVYDVSGRVVRTIADGYHGRGMHDSIWDGRDDAGRELSSGVYFIGLRTRSESITQKVVVVK